MKVAFPVAPEPEADLAEAARQLFAGPVDFLKGVVAMDGLPPADRPEVCFAGRSNVGKSSLINALTGRKTLARASNTPGRTQEINYFALGESRYLVDLPGYGYAKRSKSERQDLHDWTQHYFRESKRLRLVVQLLDIRRELQPLDMEVHDWLLAEGLPVQPVATKLDKLSRGAASAALRA